MDYTERMNTCPACSKTHFQVKDGLTATGSQRFRCQSCGKRYTPQPKPRGYSLELREHALRMYADGLGYRRIARLLKVHHQTVINWTTAAIEQLPDTPPTPDTSDTIELDELYTFVGKKKKRSTS